MCFSVCTPLLLSVNISFVLLLCRNHAWVSFEAFSEAYNDAFKLGKETGTINLYDC